jgi:predicted outer membrane repeat protein
MQLAALHVVPPRAALTCAVLAAALFAGCSDTTGPSESPSNGNETFVVDYSGAGDFLKIQEGLNAASSGDTVLIAPGTYRGTGNRDLVISGTSPVVMGMGTREETVIDCEGGGRGFRVTGACAPVIENLTIANGQRQRGGGMFVEGADASPVIRSVRFSHNNADDEGGGLYCRNGSPSLSDVLFDDNTAFATGAAMSCVGATSAPALSDVTFHGNVAQGTGGGLSCFFATPSLSGCVFWRNSAILGGAIYCGAASPAVASCTFAENEAEDGGAVYAVDQAYPTIANSIIAFSQPGRPVGCGSGGSPFTTLCCVYANAGGDSLCGGQSTSMLYLDPQFCDIEAGDLTLRYVSPCLPDNNQWNLQIGARGIGCY